MQAVPEGSSKKSRGTGEEVNGVLRGFISCILEGMDVIMAGND